MYIQSCLYHTIFEVNDMKNNKKDNYSSSTKEENKKPETFQDHWETGKFLGPNTLRHEESIKVYEDKEEE